MTNDPFVLLCYINTKLRDRYNNLDDLCYDLNLEKEEIIEKLKSINYEYNDFSNEVKMEKDYLKRLEVFYKPLVKDIESI